MRVVLITLTLYALVLSALLLLPRGYHFELVPGAYWIVEPGEPAVVSSGLYAAAGVSHRVLVDGVIEYAEWPGDANRAVVKRPGGAFAVVVHHPGAATRARPYSTWAKLLDASDNAGLDHAALRWNRPTFWTSGEGVKRITIGAVGAAVVVAVAVGALRRPKSR